MKSRRLISALTFRAAIDAFPARAWRDDCDDHLHVKSLLKRAFETQVPGAWPPGMAAVDNGNLRSSAMRRNDELLVDRAMRHRGKGFEQRGDHAQGD